MAIQSGVRDDFATRQYHSVHMHCGLILTRSENNCSPMRGGRNIQHARQILVGVLHQQPVEVDPRQLRMEIAARSNDAFHPLRADGRTIAIGVGKCANSARSHRHLGQPVSDRETLIGPRFNLLLI